MVAKWFIGQIIKQQLMDWFAMTTERDSMPQHSAAEVLQKYW